MKARTTKRLFSLLLTVAMLFSLGMPAMATDGEQSGGTENVCTKVGECGEIHIEGCALYKAPESTCKEGCVLEGEHDTCMNADEKAAADQAAEEAAAKAAAEAALAETINIRIAALPSVAEVQAMDMAALTALNTEVTAISLEIDKLADSSVIDTTSIAAVANELNKRVATLESLENAVATVKIGDAEATGYDKLKDAEEAVNGAIGNVTLTLLKDTSDDLTIKQKEGLNVVIDGAGKAYSGVIYIHGNARSTGAETLTIQNVNFTTSKSKHDFISSDTTVSTERYAHNVTVTGCSFAATGAFPNSVVGLRFRQAYNIALSNCTANGLHSVVQGTSGGTGFTVTGLKAENCKSGLSFSTCTKVSVSGCTINTVGDDGYGIRTDGSGNYSLSMENNTIAAFAPVLIRNTESENYKLNVSGTNSLTATNKDGYTVVFSKGDYDEKTPIVEPTIDVINFNNTDSGLANEKVYPVAHSAAKIGSQYFKTLQAAVNHAASGAEIVVLKDVSDEAVTVDKSLTISGDVTMNNVSITGSGTDVELAVSGLSFTGNSWINSGNVKSLSVNGVTANVTPSNTAATNSRSAFIALGRVENNNLELNVQDCDIVVSGGSDAILGWAKITEATISGNTFGSAGAHFQNADAVKFMSIATGAVFNITGNTVYSDYNGFVFGQNTTRDNAYTVNVSGNTFVGSADHVWVEVSGATTTHATVKATGTNTVNGNAFTAADIKTNVANWTSYAGVDVKTDGDGKIIGGELADYSNMELIAFGYTLNEGTVMPITTADVSTEAELREALTYPYIETINLKNDITCIGGCVGLDKDIIINGNNHKITSSADRVFRLTKSDISVVMNNVNIVSAAVRVGTSDIRGISVDANLSNVSFELNNCSVDFTDASANDWAYAINVCGNVTDSNIKISGGSYEGANVINIWSADSTITVENATITSLYPQNDVYTGACIALNNTAAGNKISYSGNTFNGVHAIAVYDAGTDNTSTDKGNNTDNTKTVVAKIGDTYYYDVQEAIDEAKAGDTVYLVNDVELSAPLNIDKAIVFDGYPHAACPENYSITSTAGSAINVTGNGNVTIQNMEITATAGSAITVSGKAKLTVTDVTAMAAEDALNVADSADGATVAVTESKLTGLSAVNVNSDDADVTVTKSELTGVGKAGTESAVLCAGKTANDSTITVDADSKITVDATAENSEMWTKLDRGTDNKIIIAGEVDTEGDNANDDTRVEANINGETKYAFLEDALAAAKAGDTVNLLLDATVTETVSAPKADLNLNGHSVTVKKGASVDTLGWDITGEATLTENKIEVSSGGKVSDGSTTYSGPITVEFAYNTAGEWVSTAVTSTGGSVVTEYDSHSGTFELFENSEVYTVTVDKGDKYEKSYSGTGEGGEKHTNKTTITGPYYEKNGDAYKAELGKKGSYVSENVTVMPDGETVTDKTTITGEFLSDDKGMTIKGTYTEEYSDGTKAALIGPASVDYESGKITINAGGSMETNEFAVSGPATIIDDTVTLGEGGSVQVKTTEVTAPAGADVKANYDETTGSFSSFVINPRTDTNDQDTAVIEGIGTVYLPALGTITVNADGSFSIDPANSYIDVNSNGVVDNKIDLNIDRDGNGTPDLNVDKNGNYKLDATDDNVDTDGNGKPNYKVIKGANQVWYYGNTWGITITVNGLFKDATGSFQHVEVDDEKLDTIHYTAKSGSTIVTLDQDYLQGLSEGKHKLTVVYTNGYGASTNFYIREPSLIPDTGDDSNVGMWAVMFGGSVAALGIAAVMLRRKKEEA